MNATFAMKAGGKLEPIIPRRSKTPKSHTPDDGGGDRCMHSPHRSRRRRRPKNPITVDTCKAKSSLEVVRLALKELGWSWKEVPYGRKSGCDIYWHSAYFHDSDEPGLYNAKVNKFPGMVEIVRKVSLTRIMGQMRNLFPDEYDFYPRSWILPDQYHHFAAEVASMAKETPKQKRFFIVKPDDGAQGEGIYLLNNPQSITSIGMVRSAVVQEYISNPLLVERKKFDLRIYVVLTSLDPLKFYLCKEGMARFCTEQYQAPSMKNLHHTYMHLTNYSLNKHSDNFIHADNVAKGSKRTMTSMWALLQEKGVDISQLCKDIEKVICKTILALIPELKVQMHAELSSGKSMPSCFQILGLDILLSSDLKPYLLEINANPSYRLDYDHEVAPGVYENLISPVDEEIKIPLVKDTLRLVKPVRRITTKSASISARPNSTDPDEITVEVSQLDLDENKSPRHRKQKESCLEELFPAKYGEQYEFVRILERIAFLFNHFLGVRGGLRMGATGFRTFTRRCKLCTFGLSTASVDILFIDMVRKWNAMNPDGISGLCFDGFVEAFSVIAYRKFRGITLQEKVVSLLDLCECHLNAGIVWPPQRRPRVRRLPRVQDSNEYLKVRKQMQGLEN
uniref:Tubulin polyglutamylase TTLL11-like n=1 Tax=Saccoglossus kowalevskii TaxID=10224 RepID=A0ABM0MRC0_SACKO|nr:PREDICTED: tubulin polyglutamylase TTLL11-like [Saccoglossus kowalevskii]